MEKETLRDRLKGSPRLKRLLDYLIMNQRDARPRWYIRLLAPLYQHRGRGSKIYRSVRMDTPPYRRFTIGRSSVVESYSCINNAVGDVIIGDHTRIGIHNTIIGPVTIGSHVNLAQGITVTALNHNFADPSLRIDQQGVSTQPVTIGDDVWIGANAVVLPGVTVGTHSVIAAGAVVTRDVPPRSVAAGVPAQVIKTLLTIVACLIVTTAAYGDVLEETLKLGLPVIDVQTVNGEFPSCDFVNPPAGCWGAAITNCTKVPGSIRVYGSDGTLSYESGDYVKDISGMTIRVRGNSSAYWAKRPFKIKLQKKADLLNRGDKKYYDKNWLLIRDLGINTTEGFKVGELLGMDYVPASQYVNVIFNGEYYGLYLLCESVKINNDCRIRADKKTGFIVELDPYWWKDSVCIKSLFSEPMEWTFKDPDAEDVTQKMWDYAARLLHNVESSLADGSYTECIDVTSFAQWILGHEVVGNADGSGANVYLCKADSTPSTMMKIPVLWDFGNIRKANGWAGMHNLHFYKTFFNKDSSNKFKRTFVKLWDEMKDRVFDGLISAISDFAESDYGKAYDRSFEVDYAKWHRYFPCDSLHADEMAKRDIAYYKERKAWLENAISPIRKELGMDIVRDDTEFLKKNGLKILDIGNSYTQDATDVLPDIVEASGMDDSDMCLWTLIRSNGSFKSWYDCYEDRDTLREYYLSRKVGTLPINLSGGMGNKGDGSLLRTALTNVQWDLIIIHPVSSAAPYYGEWYGNGNDGYLDKLLEIIRRHQPSARIGFYIVHSYWDNYTYNKEHSSLARWQLIANSVMTLEDDGGFDIVIPYGTAIENLRKSSLNNDYDLTRDGLHCCYGLAQYAAACCYYEALFAPRSGVSVLDNTARADCSDMESQFPCVPVDDDNAIIAQKAAILATKYPYLCLNPEATPLDTVIEMPSFVESKDIYTLSGMKVPAGSTLNGIYIVNGRKVTKR